MQQPSLSFRQAITADADELFRVHQASVQTFCPSAYSAQHMEAWFEGRSPGMYCPALDAGQIWVTEREGQLIGFVGVEPGEVTLLFVLPQESGRGVGRALLELALSQAANSSQEAVVVVATLNSISFYVRNGFVPLEEKAFTRGVSQLHYPVLKMHRPAGNRSVRPVARVGV